jgi:hypothetical protein
MHLWMKKVIAIMAAVVLAGGAGATAGYAASQHESKVRACTSTERSLADLLAGQAQFSATELELVRTCNRSER